MILQKQEDNFFVKSSNQTVFEQDLTDYKDWQDSFNMIVSDFLEARNAF
jgi:hypothetical protein